MKAISHFHDGRINGENILLEATIGEYLDFAKTILANNEFQRRRIKASLTLYSLLKEDILRGCVIPPIVLAFGGDGAPGGNLKNIVNLIQDRAKDLLILDGLQRTSTILELETELNEKKDASSLARLRSHPLRLEVYVGINRFGILYRMLTLNTGQTPMSLRQQVEILYLDYTTIPINGVELIREANDAAADKLGKYTFKAVIDGFTSYLESNELPIDRYDVLESVKSLQKLSKEDETKNLFQDFVRTYNKFVLKTDEMSDSYVFSSDDLKELKIQVQPFGADGRRIFSKEQAIAGFGAAIAKLKEYKKIKSFDDINTSIQQLTSNESGKTALMLLLQKLEAIRQHSKKIGNSQRLYFHFYFRELFNPEGDGYRDLGKAVEFAYQKYESQVM